MAHALQMTAPHRSPWTVSTVTLEGVERISVGFAEFFTEQWEPVVASVARVTMSRSVAEDVCAEAFARAFARWGSVAEHPSPRAWVQRVALNLGIEVYRRRRPPAWLALAARAELVDQGSAAADRIEVHDALARLTRRQREAVVLRHLVGFTEQETAQVMGCAPGSVKTHLSRGLEAMRGTLGDQWRQQ